MLTAVAVRFLLGMSSVHTSTKKLSADVCSRRRVPFVAAAAARQSDTLVRAIGTLATLRSEE